MAKRPSRAKNTKLSEILAHLNRKKRLKKILIISAFAILVIFFATGQRGTIQFVSFSKQKSDLENEIKTLEEKNKQLALQQAKEIEEEAKAKEKAVIDYRKKFN